MIDYNQVIGEDNDLIYFVKIIFDDYTYKLCSRSNVLSGWKSNFIEDSSLNISLDYIDIDKGITFNDEIELSIPRYLTNDYFSQFHNSLSPVSGKSKWLNVKVYIGVGWNGIYNENQITWIYNGIIKEYKINYDSLEFTISNDYNWIDIPEELLSKDEFPYIVEENIGKPKPIVFGYLNNSYLFYDDNNNLIMDRSYLCRAYLVDRVNGMYYVSQNPSQTLPTNYRLNYGNGYIDNMVFIVIYDSATDMEIAITNKMISDGGIIYNDENGYRIQIFNGSLNDMRGYWKYRFKYVKDYLSEKINKLLSKSNYDYEFFNYGEKIRFEIDDLFNTKLGIKEVDKYALVMHTGSGNNNVRLSFFNKKTEQNENFIVTNSNYPKTFIFNYFPSGDIKDYCLDIEPLALFSISRLYYIGYDVRLNTDRNLI